MQIAPARKHQFPLPFQSDPPRPALAPKISCFIFPPNQSHLPRIPPHAEGRFAVVTNVEAGRDGRETSQHSFYEDADERGLADGEAVWSWRPDAGVKLATMLPHCADDGDNKARSPRRAR
ncbi:MAG TPA: hypothetical protein VHB49_18355, partial [Bradyrhizobium sp.]|nr:hypothetical protein [Bradyrhizobium sp.]